MEEIKEELRYIPGYNNLYACTRSGIVVSYWFKNPKILKNLVHNKGYIVVGLYDQQGVHKKGGVFRTVASILLETWGTPKPTPAHKIEYIDGNKKNIDLSNLRWKTQSEISKKERKSRQKPIILYFNSITEACRIMKHNVQFNKNKGRKNQAGYMVFDISGFNKWQNGNV